MKYFFTITYSLFCAFIILVFSTNEYEPWLNEAPEEFANLCMLPTNYDNDPQSYTYWMLAFLLPLLIPFFLTKKKGRLFVLAIIVLLLVFWFYSFIIRFNC